MKLSETGIPGVWLRHYPTGRQRYGWTAIYGGRTYRRISRRNTLRGSAAEREKALTRLAAGLPVDEKPARVPYTVAKAVKDYLTACASLRARRRYAGHAAELTRHFGDLPVAALSQVGLAGFRKERTAAGVSPASINRDLSFLRASLNHARGEGQIEGEHYFARLSKADRRKVFVEEPRTAGIRRVTDEQFSGVNEHLPAYLRPISRILLATAMRKGEALGLRWSEVRGRSLLLTRTKSGKPREVPLTPEVAALIPRRPENAQDADLVFQGPSGGDLRGNFDRSWRAARLAAGLPWLRVHDLRHEAASRYLEAGGTLRELQELGGWSDLKLIERYAKVTRERIRETLSRLALPAENPTAECTVSARVKLVSARSAAK